MRNAQPPELGQEARAIISAARDVHQPNELSRARVRKGVELKVAAGLGLAIAPAASALAGVLKVTLVAVAVGSTVAGGFYVLPHVRARHPQAPDAHRAIARAEIAQAAPGQAAMPEATAARTPTRLLISSCISELNNRPCVASHATDSHFSGCLRYSARLPQFCRWITTPRPALK